jgi:hypothetical protein
MAWANKGGGNDPSNKDLGQIEIGLHNATMHVWHSNKIMLKNQHLVIGLTHHEKSWEKVFW